MGFLKDLYNAAVFNTVDAPFLHSLSSMSRELEHIMEVNNIEPNENRETRRKKRRKK